MTMGAVKGASELSLSGPVLAPGDHPNNLFHQNHNIDPTV
jgi:hypothetical protein